MRLLPHIGLALLATGGPALAQPGNIMGPYPGVERIAGPAMVCGEAFALRLAAGEEVQKQQGPDFILYYAGAADGPFLIYEGNHPQPHDDEIRTGMASPSVIAIHDNRSGEAKAQSRIRDRLVTGDAHAQSCPKPGGAA